MLKYPNRPVINVENMGKLQVFCHKDCKVDVLLFWGIAHGSNIIRTYETNMCASLESTWLAVQLVSGSQSPWPLAGTNMHNAAMLARIQYDQCKIQIYSLHDITPGKRPTLSGQRWLQL